MDKKTARIRRATKARAKIQENNKHRLCVYRTPKHTYAQIIAPEGDKVLACASTLEKDLRQEVKGHCGNIDAASVVGKIIAQRALKAGIEVVAFDRSGFLYHGRVKALADAARENGLKF